MQTRSSGLFGGHSPDPQAMALAEEMLSMEGVMWDILDETIPSGDETEVRESGRTLCGTNADVQGPLARFPTAVELASCPTGSSGGTWHSHVTRDQLKRPTNSLPDTANVVFGDIDVSVVVGTESAEAVVAAEDRESAAETFRDAIGAEVDTTEGVVDAILDGNIPSPPDARRRVRDRLSTLFVEERVNFTDMDRRLEQSSIPAHTTVSFELIDARHHAMVAQEMGSVGHSGHGRAHPRAARARARRSGRRVRRAARGLSVRQHATRAAVAESVKMALRSLL